MSLTVEAVVIFSNLLRIARSIVQKIRSLKKFVQKLYVHETNRAKLRMVGSVCVLYIKR